VVSILLNRALARHNWRRYCETEAFKNKNVKERLYHYADTNGIKGIIESNSIWATHLAFMNDPTEMMYGTKQIIEGWQNLLNAVDSKSQVAEILRDVIKANEDHRNNIYSFCLSGEKDLLSQWRGYTPQCMGYSIGFNMTKLNKSFGNVTEQTQPEFIPFKPIPVAYWDKEPNGFAKRFIDKLLDIVRIRNPEFYRNDLSKDELEEIGRFVSATLNLFFNYSLKHPSYKEENEVRCTNRFGREPKPKFRTRNGIVIPYVELTMKDCQKPPQKHPPNLPIEEIIIGPGLDPDHARRGLTLLLESNGYNVKNGDDDEGIEIKRSKIPYHG
jgi:hypothetical protein